MIKSFPDQLESAVTNNDKKLFIDTIFDLPADVILSFSKDEFLRIMNVSSQIYLDDADELFGFLDKNGLFFIQNGLNEVDEFNNFTISKFYYNLLIALAGYNTQRVKFAYIYGATACCNLANMNFDVIENLKLGISLYQLSQEIFLVANEFYNSALMNEGIARSAIPVLNKNTCNRRSKILIVRNHFYLY